MSGFSSEDSNICRVTCWIRIFEDIRIASKWKSMMPIKVYRLRPNIILIALFWSLPMSMGMSCVEANFFPSSWQEIKSIRLKSVGIFLGGANNDDKFFKSIMIGEEIWVYGYGVENQNSRIPSTPQVKKTNRFYYFEVLRQVFERRNLNFGAAVNWLLHRKWNDSSSWTTVHAWFSPAVVFIP